MAAGVENSDPREDDDLIRESAFMLESVESVQVEQQGSTSPRGGCVESAERQAERHLVEAACKGDERALRVIYDTHQHRVRCHLFRLLGSDSEIDDLVQIVFSRAFTALAKFEAKSSLSTWLYRITVNTTHNLIRQRFRRDRMKRALRWFDAGRGADRVSSSKVEARDEAHRILERLRPDLREVFVLYHYEGRTLAEISSIVGRPISTIGDRLTRARKQLRQLVEAATTESNDG